MDIMLLLHKIFQSFKILQNRLKCIDNSLRRELLCESQRIRPVSSSRFQYNRTIYFREKSQYIVDKYLSSMKKAINRIKYFHMTANLVQFF
ncbi:hypothetical protein N425_11035 [Tannerella sp. oral taxon BU063 isolate Cell 2]|uniref:Uncharacterized protein n=1 Tax=Tannerella sp. oral taxon BU063 isolate Cell 2 TaxID=1411148 RepID=W2C247_9BACT|nr:hypothetical protein N425_11035 [Tannerella sp. oral taxon BU063 isolate Cell 2]